MRFLTPIRPLLRAWILSFIGFTLLSFCLIGQFALSVSMPVDNAVRMALRDWFIWALVAPLLFRLVFRLPIERKNLKLALPIHVICAVTVLALNTWWSESILPPPWREGQRMERSGMPLPPGNPFSSGQHQPGSGHPVPFPEARFFSRPSPAPPGGTMRSGAPPFFFLGRLGFQFPIYLALVSLAHALYFYRRGQERERLALGLEAGLAKARLGALRMQLQPHFLFNSLNAIAELVHRDPEAADAMLVALSDLLRLALESSDEQELPLSQEIQFVERYLAVERVRMGERLRTKFDLADETLEALVPSFLLQPLVENAVRHGLEPILAGGELTVRSWREGADLYLLVADNGMGIPEGQTPRQGIGLTNIRERLQGLYGFNATLTFENKEGFIVKIRLPFHTGEQT